MPKKTKISKEDLAAFQQAVAGAKPLIIRKKESLSPHPAKRKPIADKKVEDNDNFLLNESIDIDSVKSEDFIEYKQSSISYKTLRNLRKGQYNVEAILDLHGMTVELARSAVDGFLQQCLHKDIRVVLIIHGKGRRSGMPILKNKLNHWLREINEVLAFCSAAPSYGHRGAIFVLLKRINEENVLG